MNRFKKWLRSQSVKLECDYGYMPCGELDGVCGGYSCPNYFKCNG